MEKNKRKTSTWRVPYAKKRSAKFCKCFRAPFPKWISTVTANQINSVNVSGFCFRFYRVSRLCKLKVPTCGSNVGKFLVCAQCGCKKKGDVLVEGKVWKWFSSHHLYLFFDKHQITSICFERNVLRDNSNLSESWVAIRDFCIIFHNYYYRLLQLCQYPDLVLAQLLADS